jgi:uncharacterized Ntn-hydrolase superfamily protein
MLASIAAAPLTASRARPGTYSIVARDPASGELGVAVQSHWFSVGAIATQANADVSYGPLGLELLARRVSAPDALAQLLAADAASATRQVAILDAEGRVAAHTGEQCMDFAGDVQGAGVSCQANIMASARVWPAMLEAYEGAASEIPLAQRLIGALDVAEAAGGDLRGRQSAAILVVPEDGRPWDTVVSLRVEDHPDPLVELSRLYGLHKAYVLAGRADELAGAGRHDAAAKLYIEACELAPESHELRFWAGLGAAQSGDMSAALRDVRAAIEAQPGWLELLGRLTSEQAPAARAVSERLRGRAS